MNALSPAYILDTSVLSPLGSNIAENLAGIAAQRSGIQCADDVSFFPRPILVSRLQQDVYEKIRSGSTTRFENFMLFCASDLKKKHAAILADPKTLIILSSTKGNIELLGSPDEKEKLPLVRSAAALGTYLENPNRVLVVSNACISGISACIMAQRYLHFGPYRHVLVLGCDVVSRFVLSGFASFRAVSKQGCKPFDRDRDGLVLGEACAAILFSAEKENPVSVRSGCISNDANHISGPSRTGEELAWCIDQALNAAVVNRNTTSMFISAHGTATQYNDDMESKAIERAGLRTQPVFSVKAHFGHTLGASGVLETALSAAFLAHDHVPASMGYSHHGVSGNICINREAREMKLRYALKTTSGFGGCNAAMLLEKTD